MTRLVTILLVSRRALCDELFRAVSSTDLITRMPVNFGTASKCVLFLTDRRPMAPLRVLPFPVIGPNDRFAVNVHADNGRTLGLGTARGLIRMTNT